MQSELKSAQLCTAGLARLGRTAGRPHSCQGLIGLQKDKTRHSQLYDKGSCFLVVIVAGIVAM